MPERPPKGEKQARSHGDDLRAASRLVIDATRGVMELVEEMHRTIASGPAVLGSPLEGPARAITRVVYGGLRGATEIVGSGIDRALAELTPLLGESVPGAERDAVVSALNGVLGDYLAETKNPLAITMRLCRDGAPLDLERDALRAAFPSAGTKLLVLVHGSCMNDRQWRQGDHDHGQALGQDLGYTPVYVRYNSGLHISTNGKALAELLEQLVAAWPVPLDELVVLGHSMGGLVARGACHTADERAFAWRRKLTRLISLGTPHHGAPLERGGSWLHVLLGVSRYSAPFARLARIRSAGVTDLRFGNVLDAHWESRDRFAVGRDPRRALSLPENVACYAIAGTLSAAPTKRLQSDGLVPVASALGQHAEADLTLALPESHRWISYGTGHIELLRRPEVYATLRGWLAGH